MSDSHPHSQSHSHAPEEAAATQGRVINTPEGYDEQVRVITQGQENALRKETIERAGLKPGETVLDVGCGTGNLTLHAKGIVGIQGTVYGIDPSPEMIEAAQKKAEKIKHEVHFRVGVVELMHFPDATFDVVLSSLVFHHLPPDALHKGMAEIKRVLKPGGRLFAVDMNAPSESTEKSLIMMRHAGLKVGVRDLMPLMTHLGFVNLEAGDMTTMPELGFVLAQRGN